MTNIKYTRRLRDLTFDQMPPYYEQDEDTDAKEYYPALLGETLRPDAHSKVVIVRKLGWGKLSNVWLVRSVDK